MSCCLHHLFPPQLTGAKDPAALEQLVKATGVKPENVNRWFYLRSCPEDDGFEASLSSSPCRDLMLYKSILSKLNAAKELMAEFVQREKKKQAEREADKAARAAKVCMYVCAHLRALHVLNFGPLRARLRRRQCTRSPEAVSYVMLPHFTG
eukprot:1155443-Pelagomonas_calceolata.AAC.13